MEDKECDILVQKLGSDAKQLLSTRALIAAVDVSGHLANLEGYFEWELRPPDGVIPSGSTVFTDGSMIDGPTKTIGRVGFGMAAFDNEGILIAKAFGTPPRWIDSVPGAEAWAVSEAIRHSIPEITI